MPTFIILGSYTDQGIRTIKDSPKRVDALKALARKMGGEVKGFYLTMGAHDFVIVAEAPGADVVAKVVLALGSLGNARTMTLRAFNESEFRQIVADLPKVG
jgi:uncharacterized protein with GYD domain